MMELTRYSVVMDGLSTHLFVELKMHLFNKLFTTAPFFKDAPKEFLNAVRDAEPE